MKKVLSFEEILAAVQNLTPSEMRKVNTAYIADKDKQLDKRINKLVTIDLQNRIIDILGKEKRCPECSSNIIVNFGKRSNGVQRLKCKDCGHTFTYFTGTILEKTKFHWDFWIDMIHMMLHNATLEEIKANLEESHNCQGIHIETIFNWRHKIFEAAKNVREPQLKGVVEIDETYVREGQKGADFLYDPFNNKGSRKRRETRTSSKYGVLGPEFGNIVCAVDHSNHVIAKVIGTGSCSEEVFESLFHQHLQKTTWICTDANRIYSKYCTKYSLNHYVRPSHYLKNLKEGKDKGLSEAKMYRDELLDYIEADGRANLPYNKFIKIKKDNKLNLSHVNQFHSVLHQNIVAKTHGISLKHLEGYVAWQCLLINFKTDTGHAANTKEDAKIILEMLLKTKSNILVSEISSKKPDFSNSKKRYVNKLKSVTNDVRKQSEGKLFDYTLTSEDAGANFNLREFLETLPLYALREITKMCKIEGYSTIRKGHTYKFIRLVEKHPDINNIIVRFRINHPSKKTD